MVMASFVWFYKYSLVIWYIYLFFFISFWNFSFNCRCFYGHAPAHFQVSADSEASEPGFHIIDRANFFRGTINEKLLPIFQVRVSFKVSEQDFDACFIG